MFIRAMFLAAVAVLSVAALADSASQPGLLLVPGIYGLPDKDIDGQLLRHSVAIPGGGSACVAERPADGGLGLCSAHIDDHFLAAIGYDRGSPDDAIQELAKLFDEAFGGVKVSEVNARNKFRTYAVSLQVARAGQFAVDLGQWVDVYLPISVNLYFTNILTGEVLYSLSRSEYQNLRVTQAEFADKTALKERVIASYKANFSGQLRTLIQEAKQKFKPFQIEATVTKVWKGYYLLDRGQDRGIGMGNELVSPTGAGLRVIYVDRNYSVAVPSLGETKEGERVSLYSMASASSVRKPRVMVLDASSPSSYPGSIVAQQFADSIGDGASFSVVVVNPTFQSVLRTIMTSSGLQQAEVSQRRALPDYFIRIWLPEGQMFDMPTDREFARTRVSTGSIYAELIDTSGRVIFSATANDEIVEPVVSGLAIDSENRLRILYGNLVKELVGKFIAGVKFENSELILALAPDGGVSVVDPAGLLAVNQNVRAFRIDDKLVKDWGVVRVPTWELQVVSRGDGVALLAPVVPTTGSADDSLKLRSGDVVMLEGGRPGASRVSLSMCSTQKDIGTVHVERLPAIAHFGMGQWLKAPFFLGDHKLAPDDMTFSESIARLKNAGFKQAFSAASSQAGYCVEPLVKITPAQRECSKGRCDVSTDMVVGFQFRKADAVFGKRGVNARIESRGVPEEGVDAYVIRKAELRLQELYKQLAAMADVTALP
jgi:hypothetical protein